MQKFSLSYSWVICRNTKSLVVPYSAESANDKHLSFHVSEVDDSSSSSSPLKSLTREGVFGVGAVEF